MTFDESARAEGPSPLGGENADAFSRWLVRHEAYDAAIRADGDSPWYERPDHLARVTAQLGLPEGTPAIDVRRALWDRSKGGSR